MINKDYIHVVNKRLRPRNWLLRRLTRRIYVSHGLQFLIFFIGTFTMFLVLMWLGLIYEV